MVTVSNFFEMKNEEGESFVSLELSGDLEMVQSQTTGLFYATSRRCRINSTFNVELAKTMVGKTLSGNLAKIQCEEYDYTIQDTGEIVRLGHRYVYMPEGAFPDAYLNVNETPQAEKKKSISLLNR
ncbi:hypothetical protein V7S76_09785 [Aquirufa sp. ROCK2-A2]